MRETIKMSVFNITDTTLATTKKNTIEKNNTKLYESILN